jgi:3-oxoacyl-[acyl-carrier protein] reductase
LSLTGQIALVTGASRGIGRATALALGRQGAYIVINYRDNQTAAEQTLAALCSLEQGRGELCRFDVTDENQIDAAVKKIVDGHQKIDILVNNAGIAADNLLIRVKADDWEQVVGTNLKGTILCTKAVTRVMLRQRYGRIINLSSVVGQTGNAGQSLYAATKSGILGFTKAMAREVASRGITVNAKLQEESLRSIPLGRFGTCDEVAEVIVFLSGSGAGYITGQVIAVNGGMYM